MSFDLDDKVIDYIEQAVKLPVPLETGRQDQSGPAIIYIMQPMQKYTRYYNGRVKRSFAFQIAAKLPRMEEAIQVLNDINSAIERAKPGDINSASGSFCFRNAQMTQNPSYKDTIEDAGVTYSVYAASFEVEVIIN
ncbi:hypothetical protein I3F57_06195 [Lacticaseibacillus paracasei subsp. tolerans]|uniref:hypothetical protein n=1 Tax=Lacticaseibacillus paracasei TaxID=1597 RepID=UPI0018AD5E04|nr:hypothetical protein [Lacticaseibacillus paracasei]QPI89333.1 hypothetical protein I3F57_06195 [Lacticaseibacillus paracasei subsp. tolerans]